MVEVSLTVGKLDASLALLLTKDHHLIEFPTILLPNGVKAGSIVKIRCDQDFESERQEAKQFQKIQDSILATFGTNVPKNPVLKIRNTTQTSCVLEWEPLDLGTASLKNLFLIKNSKKLGAIPQPLTNRTTKLSGLPIDKTFEFQLRLDTTAGVYLSETIEVTTHKMTDLTGITVCLGDISVNDPFSVQDIEDTLKNIGAKPLQKTIQVDTTHFICTRENSNNPEYLKACEMNIPVVRPEWLKTCERERRIVGVRDYYTKDCLLPDILAKNYWAKSGTSSEQKAETVDEDPAVSDFQNKSLPEVKIETPLEEVAINEKDNLTEAEPELEESGINDANSNEFSEEAEVAENIELGTTEESERITKPHEGNDNEINDEQISNGVEEITHHTEVEQPTSGENEASTEPSVEESAVEERPIAESKSGKQAAEDQAVEDQAVEDQASEDQAVEDQIPEEKTPVEHVNEEQAVEEQAVEELNEEDPKEEDPKEEYLKIEEPESEEPKEADENADDDIEGDNDDEDNNDIDAANTASEQNATSSPNSLSGKKKKNKKKKKSKN